MKLDNCRKQQSVKDKTWPEKSRSWAENISRQSDDEVPSLWWTRWSDVDPRQRDRLRRCPRGRSSTCSTLVAWTIGVWCRVLVRTTMLCSYCTTSFIESQGRKLRHTHTQRHRNQQQTLLTDWVKVLRLTRHKIGHFGDVPKTISWLGMEKQNLTQQ